MKETTVDTGILGLGYSSNESGHPSILDKLKSAGHIAARAYSLYLVSLPLGCALANKKEESICTIAKILPRTTTRQTQAVYCSAA